MLELPYPPKELSPNARVHWSKKSKIYKAYKNQISWIAKTHEPMTEFAIIFCPRSSAQDHDNAISSFKAGQDGLSVAWGINDRDFKITYLPMGKSVKNGKIIIKSV